MPRCETAPRRSGTMRVVRSRGALSGFLLLLLGIWGALIPFVGPYFDYAYTPNSAWVRTSGRFWLELLPGIATAVAGLMLMVTANRSVGSSPAGWPASPAPGSSSARSWAGSGTARGRRGHARGRHGTARCGSRSASSPVWAR